MFHRFRYEAAFYPSLTRIPLDVRMKLDLIGIKISLKDWLAFSFEERTALCHLPAEDEEERSVFTTYVDSLCRRYCDRAVEFTERLDPAHWQAGAIPAEVAQKCTACFNTVTIAEWQSWEPHQRYALYKTAVSKSQPEAFADILNELRGTK